MKIALMFLAVANILYFMWGQFVAAPVDRGVVVVNEAALGPALSVVRSATTETTPDDVGTVSVERPSEFAAAIGRSCVSIGPFKTNPEADAAMAEYRDEGMLASVRTTEGELFVGHWVQIRNIPDREAGNAILEQLRAGGLGDAYLVPTDEEGLKISLGLFGEMARAERVELQAKSLDLPADITRRMREATVFFVDIGLPPGKGASEMIEKHGEENVLFRDLATCPRDD